MMLRKNLIFGTFLSVFIAVFVVGAALWYGSRPPKRGGDFTLKFRDQNWTLSEHAKKLSLVYVGYAKCPDVCPLSLSYAAQSFRKLTADELQNVQMIFISVDENDTPFSVADYAEQFDKGFIGLAGPKDQVDAAIAKLGASYMVEKNPKSYLGYSIAHTDRIFFLNKKGIVLDSLANPHSEESITQEIRGHL